MSSTEVETISKLQSPPRKMASKSHHLVRTSSLEKIRRFNSFICSQQYNILPALFAWLRSSQSVLQKAEKTMLFFRALLFCHFLYKIEKLRKQTFALKLAVYLTAIVLIVELGLCFYLLCSTHVPSGLIFLIISFFYIIYLNARSVYFAREVKSRDEKKRN
ncbi:uncharacterized protein LOC123009037 [Tribolium madens]|uniref:uncharacterized protein LOC123009037 n=1 Tax=Tribolium madens TaxID=41895 RepID=UPI001CF7501C|nr:uncharacterized protein LOC123009037 [Tribolium madens]XP_044261073.1 uncharacterized protein LOC123009037 [Tribolium madens]XP_044261074.1 uncharacterized protein LOC123009037 [Tribolium madens]